MLWLSLPHLSYRWLRGKSGRPLDMLTDRFVINGVCAVGVFSSGLVSVRVTLGITFPSGVTKSLPS